MALKDHITDSAKINEEEIEAIIADYVKYDPSNEALVFLPKTHTLSVEKKILLCLVALRGWRFVVNENTPASDALPREIERITGVRGGTLRPTLRALVQSNMIDSKKGRYEIPAHNLGRVREVMSSGGSTVVIRHPISTKAKKSKVATAKKNNTSRPSISEAFEALLNSNWFRGGKTITQLKEKLEEGAIIVPSSRLPVYLLKAVGGKPQRLERNKRDIDGKRVWVYSPKE